MYEPIRETLAGLGVALRLGEGVVGVAASKEGFILQTARRRIRAKRLISTIPLDQAAALFGVTNASPLPYGGLATLYFSFEGDRGFSAPILYNFAKGGNWKRLTVHSDYYGDRNGREYFSLEVPLRMAPSNYKELAASFRRDTASVGLFKGDLRLEGGDFLSTAYPIYLPGASERAAGLIGSLKALGVESGGRQGRFEYLPTAKLTAQRTLAALHAKT